MFRGMRNTVLGSVLVAMSLTLFGCQPGGEDALEGEEVGEASFVDEGRTPAEPTLVPGGNMYPEGSYVTGIQPFFDDDTCEGNMAWGTSITPGGSGKLYYLVVTKDTTPPMVWYPGDQVLPAGYGLGKDDSCKPIDSIIKPPGGKWVRWYGTPLSDF